MAAKETFLEYMYWVVPDTNGTELVVNPQALYWISKKRLKISSISSFGG
jgi:hypothetical protein